MEQTFGESEIDNWTRINRRWKCTSTLYGPRCDQVDYLDDPSLFDTKLECQESKCFVNSAYSMQSPRMVGLVGEYLDPYTLKELASHDQFTRAELVSSLAKVDVARAMLAELVKCPFKFAPWFKFETWLVFPSDDQTHDHEVAVLVLDMLVDYLSVRPSNETQCARYGITKRVYILDFASNHLDSRDFNNFILDIIGDFPSSLPVETVKDVGLFLNIFNPGWASDATPEDIARIIEFKSPYSKLEIITDEILREVEKRPEILKSGAILRALTRSQSRIDGSPQAQRDAKMIQHLIDKLKTLEIII